MRTLKFAKPLMHGNDVRELQKLLHVPVDGQYGTATAAGVYKRKVALGYAKPDHVAGDLFHTYLTGKKKPTAAMAKRAAARKAKLSKVGTTSKTPKKAAEKPGALKATADHKMRATAEKTMRLLLSRESKVHYAQIRLMRTRTITTYAQLVAALDTAAGVTMDCSESDTLIDRVSGGKDPSNNGFSGTGFTGTILAESPTITKSQLRVGDKVLFGPGDGHHICTVLEPGPDPLLFSHGQEKGPMAIRLSVEAQYQPEGIRYRALVAKA